MESGMERMITVISSSIESGLPLLKSYSAMNLLLFFDGLYFFCTFAVAIKITGYCIDFGV